MAWRRTAINYSRIFMRYGIPCTIASGFCAYKICNNQKMTLLQNTSLIKTAFCETSNTQVQDSVLSQPKSHALYLTIHLKPTADPVACVRALSKLTASIDQICPPGMRDESDEILCGIGFGPHFLRRVYPSHVDNSVTPFPYVLRKSEVGDLPATGGDIFIHAKCHERGKLHEVADSVMKSLPVDSVASAEDVYGWSYQNGRDLSGFIDGTENPADDDDRKAVAINKKTGGSYVMTQKWVHNYKVQSTEKVSTMEGWVGRTYNDSVELKKLPKTSHVFRMDPRDPSDKNPKKFEIVRQSQPWGTVTGKSGLFFIAYAASPANFDWMLDRMTGAGKEDNLSDDIMRLTQCTTGAYFYVPSKKELEAIYTQTSVAARKSSGKLW